MKIIVLGAGRVGRAIARDLAADPDLKVTVADRSPEALKALEGVPNLTLRQADLGDQAALKKVLRGEELGVGAVPGHMGYRTLQGILEAGCHAVDIAFFREDPFQLDGLARTQGLTALVDCGIAPGCSNLILGHHEATIERTTRFQCLVGGLPVVRHWPFQYRAPFSPADVIEEYTRAARLRRDGRTVTLPALSELETVDLPGVGALEAFNTDGLRTLLRTCETPEMSEKTLRYPGHAEWMKGLRETGFFGTRPIQVSEGRVSPLEVTVRLLEKAWAFEEGEEDITVMWVRVDGYRKGKGESHTYYLLDRYDREGRVSSMARTTGYTCTAMVRMLARGMYREPGVNPPELVGREAPCYEFILGELAARGVVFQHEVKPLEE